MSTASTSANGHIRLHTGSSTGDSESFIYNNTFIGGYDGVYSASSDSSKDHVKNNLFSNLSGDEVGTGGFSLDNTYNATDDSTMDDETGTGDRTSQTFTFVNAAGDNYQLESTDTGARDHGTDLSADVDYPITVDIVGNSRPYNSTFDIGASEYTLAEYSFTTSGGITFGGTMGELLEMSYETSGEFALGGSSNYATARSLTIPTLELYIESGLEFEQYGSGVTLHPDGTVTIDPGTPIAIDSDAKIFVRPGIRKQRWEHCDHCGLTFPRSQMIQYNNAWLGIPCTCYKDALKERE